MAPLRSETRAELFLPDFCGIRMVFAMVVVGELLAIVLTLNPAARSVGGFRELALSSLFIQWVGLLSCALLCVSRRALERFGNRTAAACSYALILLVTLAVSEAAWRLILPRLAESDLATLWQFEHGPAGLGAARAVTASLSHAEFLLRNLGIAAVMALVALRYFYLQHQSRARMQSESQARIQALQSRIRPHFLFNSMNTIASLARSAPALAEQVTEDLAALFRVSLGDASVPATLAQELEVCRQYLRIESQRLGDRLVCEHHTDELPGDAMLPALTLQPLLENAVYHGVEPAPGGGRIALSGALDGDTVRVSIENSLPPAGARAARASNAMALDNVRQRVEAYFGGAARLRISSGEERFRVDLEFPYRTTKQ